MLSERLSVLIESVGASNTDISKLADCAPSYISRLRSGERVPKMNTSAMRRLATAICTFADNNHCENILRNTMGIDDKQAYKFDTDEVLRWMYESSDIIPDSTADISEKSRVFTNKLDALISLSGTSNKELSDALSVDPSYISRIRKGSRTLKRQSRMLTELGDSLGKKIIDIGKRYRLSELTTVPIDTINDDTVGAIVSSWLLDCSTGTEAVYIKKILESINNCGSYSKASLTGASSFEAMRSANTDVSSYYGINGIRTAFARLVNEAVRNGCKELLLYSDQGISWTIGEFHSTWFGLLKECLAHDIKIRIIHYIQRDNLEMLAGINSWMPLYMSGLIDSYFLTVPVGELFGRLFYIAPGVGCIDSCCARGFEDKSEYRYITDSSRLSDLQSEFEYLLSVSKKLVHYSSQLKNIPPHAMTKTVDNIELGAADGIVIVNRRFPSPASFTFDNQRVYNAFRKYLE